MGHEVFGRIGNHVCLQRYRRLSPNCARLCLCLPWWLDDRGSCPANICRTNPSLNSASILALVTASVRNIVSVYARQAWVSVVELS